MITVEHRQRLLKLSTSFREIRRKNPYASCFPDELKVESTALLNAGIDAEKIATDCGLGVNTVLRWQTQHPSKLEFPEVVSLQVVAERKAPSPIKNEQPIQMCELLLGSSVVIRIPMEGLTKDLLGNLREAFQLC
jgi:hypothetical protein